MNGVATRTGFYIVTKICGSERFESNIANFPSPPTEANILLSPVEIIHVFKAIGMLVRG